MEITNSFPFFMNDLSLCRDSSDRLYKAKSELGFYSIISAYSRESRQPAHLRRQEQSK